MYNHVNLLHVVFSGPLLIYIGLVKPHIDWLYNLIGIIGIFLLLSFIIKIVTHKSLSQRHVYYAIHALLFAPLLMYLGWAKHESPNVVFSLSLAIGISALGYHAIRLIQSRT
jgi:hypothetical protein